MSEKPVVGVVVPARGSGGRLGGSPINQVLPGVPAAISDEQESAVAKQRSQADAVRKAELQLQHRTRLVSWGVPIKDVERVVLQGLDPTKALAAVEKLEADTDNDKCILVLSGSIGCGKTTAAAWWLSQPGPKSPYLKLTPPLFIPVYRLERFTRYSESDMVRVELARRLVIDDLGTEYNDAKGFFVTQLRGIVDARYAQRLPLVITTNLSPDDFKERYGDRTADRLREVGRWIGIQAKSMRKKK